MIDQQKGSSGLSRSRLVGVWFNPRRPLRKHSKTIAPRATVNLCFDVRKAKGARRELFEDRLSALSHEASS
ncbi:MAG TPA: hypothetical protein VM711_08120 [Sphingomicrobium sp.]|nr:hypothetical protein [Sphingomicrobium sp.]